MHQNPGSCLALQNRELPCTWAGNQPAWNKAYPSGYADDIERRLHRKQIGARRQSLGSISVPRHEQPLVGFAFAHCYWLVWNGILTGRYVCMHGYIVDATTVLRTASCTGAV